MINLPGIGLIPVLPSFSVFFLEARTMLLRAMSFFAEHCLLLLMQKQQVSNAILMSMQSFHHLLPFMLKRYILILENYHYQQQHYQLHDKFLTLYWLIIGCHNAYHIPYTSSSEHLWPVWCWWWNASSWSFTSSWIFVILQRVHALLTTLASFIFLKISARYLSFSHHSPAPPLNLS